MLGAVTSLLVTVNVQFVELPLASVAVRVTVVTPTPFNTVPAAGDWVTVTAEQLSVARVVV